MSSYAQGIKEDLQYINDTFIGDPRVQNYFLGQLATGVTTNNYFTNLITNYDNFKNAFFPSSVTVDATLLSSIKVKPLTDKNWGPVTDVQNITQDNNTFETTHYISFKDVGFINDTTKPVSLMLKGTDASPSMNVIDLLNSFTATYNFLNPVNLNQYKRGIDITTLKDYQGNPLYIKTVDSVSTVTSQNHIINRIVSIEAIGSPSTTARIDAIRRILLAYIYMIEIYIALFIYDKNTDGTNFTAKNVLESCIKKFNKLNDNIYDTTTRQGVATLYTGLERRVASYKNSKAELNNISTEINELKTDITIEKNTINSHSEFLKSNQIIFYVFMSLFIILVAGLFYVYSSTTLPPAFKKTVYLLITGASLVLFVLAVSVNKFVVIEPFNTTGTYNDQIMRIFSEYLAHTINLMRVVDTYRSYGEVSTAINKEKNFYSNMSVQLEQNKATLNAVQAEKFRQGKVLRFRTYLFIQILITLSILVLILSYQFSVVYIVMAAFVMLVWVYFYIFNVNNLVHTDARKYYWQQPSMD